MSSFPKSSRLRTSRQFREVQQGKEKVGRYTVIHTKTAGYGAPLKLGITVSRHYGKAHERNRFKRLVREAFRQGTGDFAKPLHIHVKPRSHAKRAKMQDIQHELYALVGLKTQELLTLASN